MKRCLKGVNISLPIASIIIPTRNRAHVLKDTLTSLKECAGFEECELIVCDDGSEDNTLKVIEAFRISNSNINIRVLSSGRLGVAKQRNRASDIAVGAILIFAADDIRPLYKTWILDHIKLHSLHLESSFAVLGKITWPPTSILPSNAVMTTVQGRGGEQFGYADLISNTFLDWRFFYTSNLSVKKNLVSSWKNEGFSETFEEINFEDIEFAYRLFKSAKLNLFYSSVPVAHHYQIMSVHQFCERQRTAGRMAVNFCKLHPEIGGLLLPSIKQKGEIEGISLILSIFSGYLSYVEWLENRGILGTEAWHTDLLHDLFALYFQLGVLDASDDWSSQKIADFLESILQEHLEYLNRNIGLTLFGTEFKMVVSDTKIDLPSNTFKFFGMFRIRIPRSWIRRLMQNAFLRGFYLRIRKYGLVSKL